MRLQDFLNVVGDVGTMEMDVDISYLSDSTLGGEPVVIEHRYHVCGVGADTTGNTPVLRITSCDPAAYDRILHGSRPGDVNRSLGAPKSPAPTTEELLMQFSEWCDQPEIRDNLSLTHEQLAQMFVTENLGRLS